MSFFFFSFSSSYLLMLVAEELTFHPWVDA